MYMLWNNKQQDFIETISRLSQRYKIEGVDPDKLLFELYSFDKYIIFIITDIVNVWYDQLLIR